MARDALTKHIGRGERTCAATARDAYRRYLATCLVEGLAVGSWQVRSGCALSFVRDAKTDDADMDAARKAAVGMWGGSFIAPWDSRQQNCSTEVFGAREVSLADHRKICDAHNT